MPLLGAADGTLPQLTPFLSSGWGFKPGWASGLVLGPSLGSSRDAGADQGARSGGFA